MGDTVVREGDWPQAADEERQAEAGMSRALEEVGIVARHVPPDRRDMLWSAVQRLEDRHRAWLEAKQRTVETVGPIPDCGPAFEAACAAAQEAEVALGEAMHEAARLTQYVPVMRRDALWNAVRLAHLRWLDYQRLSRRTMEAMHVWMGVGG